MGDFPDIRAPDWTQFSQKKYKRQIRTNMESGKVHSRPAHTAIKYIFKTGWKWLTNADYVLLETHFEENIGNTFNWTHQDTTVYVVRYVNDEFPEVEPLGDGNPDYWLGPEELMLEEA